MVSEQTQQAIWLGVLEASRVSRYYGALRDKYAIRTKIQSLLSPSVGAIAVISVVTKDEYFLLAAEGYFYLFHL